MEKICRGGRTFPKEQRIKELGLQMASIVEGGDRHEDAEAVGD